MQFFTNDYLEFFKDLASNNNREWFQSNKKRYEKSVKQPFKVFTQALINEIRNLDNRILIEPKHAISRINRDIRFSADKTPYNLHLNVFIAPEGKKDPNNGAFALRFSADMLGVMGGFYQLDKEQLRRLRGNLMDEKCELRSLTEESKFKNHFPEIKGEKMKRIPKDLKEACLKEPFILHKQFYFISELPKGLIVSDELMPNLIKVYKIMQPVNACLTELVKA